MKIELSRKKLLSFGIPVLVLCLVPVFLGGSPHIMHIMIMCLIWAIVATAWDLVIGYGGIFSVGQVAFFAIGAYTSALMTKVGVNTLGLGISPWLGILMAGIIAGVVGFIISLPCLRLKGAYIALVTFALHMTIPPLVRAGQPIGTGGVGSLVGIPPLQLGSYIFTPMDRLPSYWVALAIFCALMFAVYKIINSRFGLAYVALRDDEPFARSLGINMYRSQVMLFAISAFITGIMGGFYAHYLGLISHGILGLDIFVLVLVMVIVGGMGKFPGAAIAAFIFTFANELLRPLEGFRAIILGGIIIAVVILSPQGLMGIPDLVRGFFRRRKPAMEEIK